MSEPFRFTHRQRVFGALLGMLTACALSGCGYAVGPPYDQEVRSVYVETFDSNLYRRGLEFQLTEAVQRQIQTQTPLQLQKPPYADTKLSGRILSVQKHTLGQSGFDEARQLETRFRVQVTWEDLRTGELLKQQEIELAPDLVQLSNEGDFAPELGQSLATSYQVALNRLSRDIVQMMETPW